MSILTQDQINRLWQTSREHKQANENWTIRLEANKELNESIDDFYRNLDDLYGDLDNE